jgi:hypothetical protein
LARVSLSEGGEPRLMIWVLEDDVMEATEIEVGVVGDGF